MVCDLFEFCYLVYFCGCLLSERNKKCVGKSCLRCTFIGYAILFDALSSHSSLFVVSIYVVF